MVEFILANGTKFWLFSPNDKSVFHQDIREYFLYKKKIKHHSIDLTFAVRLLWLRLSELNTCYSEVLWNIIDSYIVKHYSSAPKQFSSACAFTLNIRVSRVSATIPGPSGSCSIFIQFIMFMGLPFFSVISDCVKLFSPLFIFPSSGLVTLRKSPDASAYNTAHL